MHTAVRLFTFLAVVAPLACGNATPAIEAVQKTTPVPVAPAAAAPASQPLTSLADLVDSVKASVVNVEVVSRVKAPVFGGGDVFERFFGPGFRGGPMMPGPRMQPREQLKQGQGSGFIIRADGLVLTNNHVIEGADTIRLKLDDGRSFTAKILGRDPLTDVALLKIESDVKGLPVAVLGDSDAQRVGDPVVAIGNPFGLASSVSAGIVSAKARRIGAGPYDDFLQTDAAINPGNSGGPLFNARGEVIGMNTAIIGGGTGIGFAVPSNLIKALLPQLEKSGAVTRGWLGVAIQGLTPELAKGLQVPVEKGALVSSVNDGSPAAKAGLRADDVIVAVDGEDVGSHEDLTRKIALKSPGSVTQLTVYRDARKVTLPVTLGTRPDLEGRGVEPSAPQRESRHERWGMTVQDAPNGEGAMVIAVNPGSPAERAGLQAGMVIVEAGGKAVGGANDLERQLADAKSGNVVLLRVQVEGGGRMLRALTVP